MVAAYGEAHLLRELRERGGRLLDFGQYLLAQPEAWNAFRKGAVTELVRQTRQMLKEMRPNALLSAGNTTDVASLQQNSISLSPTQAGAPAFPHLLGAPMPSVATFARAWCTAPGFRWASR